MPQAVIADIHSNLEAFKAVLEHIEKQGVTEIISLGDLVGYGPNPVECITLAIEQKIINIAGNHELALYREKTNFNPIAQRAIDWTGQIIQANKTKPAVKTFFETLKKDYLKNGIVYAHGSPRGIIDEYVIKKDDFFRLTKEVKDSLRENFAEIQTIGFVGHTHIPYICTTDFYLVHPEWQDYQPYPLLTGTKTLVNPGSVGQPRDYDPRACYAVYDGTQVTHYRVEYDIEKTVQAIQAIGELDKALWMRLRRGS